MNIHMEKVTFIDPRGNKSHFDSYFVQGRLIRLVLFCLLVNGILTAVLKKKSFSFKPVLGTCKFHSFWTSGRCLCLRYTINPLCRLFSNWGTLEKSCTLLRFRACEVEAGEPEARGAGEGARKRWQKPSWGARKTSEVASSWKKNGGEKRRWRMPQAIARYIEFNT